MKAEDRDRELEFERFLAGEISADEELADLAMLAKDIEIAMAAPPPTSIARERALFVAGASAKAPRPSPFRLLAPVAAAACLLAAIAIVGRGALPGQALYPVRQVLHSIGLAPSTTQDVANRIAQARTLIASARADLAQGNTTQARAEAVRALFALGQAQSLASVLDRPDFLAKIGVLRGDAESLINGVDPRSESSGSGSAGTQSGSSDSSGPSGGEDQGGRQSSSSGPSDTSGQGNSGPSDDNSGPSGETGDENKGSGSSASSSPSASDGEGDHSGKDDSGSGDDHSGSNDSSDDSHSGSGSSGSSGDDSEGSNSGSTGSGDDQPSTAPSPGDDSPDDSLTQSAGLSQPLGG